ncbi:MAG: DUF4384 domain-containing protein [Blastocatellia bacterium]|nr:DUF4384 domain-containing protein [Blastocatellia bacterium]
MSRLFQKQMFPTNLIPLWFGLMVLLLPTALPTVAQEPQTDSRDIVRIYDTFQRKRRPQTSVAKAPEPKPAQPQSQTTVQRLIGVTFWKVVPEKNPRLLSQGAAKVADGWVAERVSPETRFSNGDRVRLTIEVPEEGYLYIFDREKYADGTFGDPYLIFPSKTIRNGDNLVGPGLLVGLPAQTDNPPYLDLTQSRSNHTAEEISLLVVAKPIPGLITDHDPLKIEKAQFEAWNRLQTRTRQLELPMSRETVGYTLKEREAENGVSARRLQQGDPLPQRLLQVETTQNALLVTVPLLIGKAK